VIAQFKDNTAAQSVSNPREHLYATGFTSPGADTLGGLKQFNINAIPNRGGTIMTAYDQPIKETQVPGSGYDDEDMTTTNIDARKHTCPVDPGNPGKGVTGFVTWAGREWWLNYKWGFDQNGQPTGTYVWDNRSNFDPKQFLRPNPDGSLTLRAFDPKPGIPPADPWPAGKPACITAEIATRDALGYGDYVVTARANRPFAKFDDNVIFGVFTYQYGGANPAEDLNKHREIDLLETISHNAQGLNGNAQFTLQLADKNKIDPKTNKPYLIERFALPADCSEVTMWLRRSATDDENLATTTRLAIYNGSFDYDHLSKHPDDNLIHPWDPAFLDLKPGDTVRKLNEDYMKHIPHHIPGRSRERLHINLYLSDTELGEKLPKGWPPKSGEHSVTLTRFEYRAK
jgi:plastocyanin